MIEWGKGVGDIELGDFGATFQYLELRFGFLAGLGWAERQFNCIAVCLKMERIGSASL
jgi:hypothetical protein